MVTIKMNIFFCHQFHQKLYWYIVVDDVDLYQQTINASVK